MLYLFGRNQYTFACVGLNVKEKDFPSRHEANQYMFNLIGKHGLRVEKVYDDKHHKTYVCNNGIRFFIQRAN